MAKDDHFYRPMGKHAPDTIVSASRGHHSMLRRQPAHGFSERSMRPQEPIFRKYVHLLVRRLEGNSDNGRVPLDMRAWFNYVTFDVIRNLSFGSDFSCLEKSQAHPWVDAVTFRLARRRHYAGHDASHAPLVHSMGEIQVNASVLVLAGSGTTATLFSCAFYLLGTYLHILVQVIQEVRSAFGSEEEIDLISVSRLGYMLACLKESLRLYPPATPGLPRVVPKGGIDIAGHYVPQDNFTRLDDFRPERFLGEPELADDDLKAMQPFSVEPWNCIGME
ncbi:hypothetical protein VUR80DRAFT_6848 [Thermomyces stellatus]